jgi:trans-2,3-dihydro-3-hydroxyanthranilate isomerase
LTGLAAADEKKGLGGSVRLCLMSRDQGTKKARCMGLTYHILDVFTDRPFGGNPLAVVMDADRLSAAEMLQIAREFNLSETVFVLAPQSAGHSARMRIFTPSREIPFAGHPTLGTAILLAELRMPIVNGERDAIIALEQETGSVRVGVRLRQGGPAHGEFDAPKAEAALEPLGDVEEVAAALGLIPSELGFENHRPMLRPAAGTCFAYVPMANLEAMSKIRVAPSHWAKSVTDRNIDGLYLYARQCVRVNANFHARMLAPDLGIAEDPATGAAAIGLAHVIQAFDQPPDGIIRRVIEQGLEMGRPSLIQLTMTVARGKLDNIRIGGHAVRIAEGRLLI